MIKPLLIAAIVAAPMAQAAIDCRSISETAEIIMTKRQQEVSRIVLEDVVKGQENLGAYKQIALAIIDDAYRQRAMSHPDNQKLAVSRFANDVYSECMRGFK